MNLTEDSLAYHLSVKITNKSNFVLKDEAPNIEFEYTRGTGDSKESTVLHKEDLWFL